MSEKYDVVQVQIDSLEIQIMAEDKSISSAESIENMCVMSRGVEDHFYAVVPAGKYKNGDKWAQ